MRIRSLYLLILLSGISLFCIKNASFSYFPEKNSKIISLSIDLKGSYQEAVEEIITNPLEKVLLTLDGIKRIESVSEDEKAVITVLFHDEIDLDRAYLMVRQSVDRVSAGFPSQAGKPRLFRNDSRSRAVYILMLDHSFGRDKAALEKMFQGIPGVGQVDVSGAPPRDVVLKGNAGILSYYNTQASTISATLADNNKIVSVPLPGESLLTGDFRYISLEDFASQRIRAGVQIQNLLRPEWENAPPDSISRFNGEEKILVGIKKAGDGNTIRLCRELEKIRKDLKGTQVLYNRGQLMESALKNMAFAILAGILSVFLVTGILLKDFRNAFLISLNIPFSLLIALALLVMLGREIDLMILAGFCIASGLLIDAGVVVLECGSGESRDPVLYSVFSTLVVFTVFLFAPPPFRRLYGGIIRSITLVILVSVFYLFIILPGLSGEKNGPAVHKEFSADNLMTFVFRYPRVNGIIILVLFLSGLFSFSNLKIQHDFFLEDNNLSFSLEYPAGKTKEEISHELKFLENRMNRWPEVESFSSDFRSEKAVFNISTAGSHRSASEKIQNRLKEMEQSFSGGLFFTGDPLSARYDVILMGYDRPLLYRQAVSLAEYLQIRQNLFQVILHFKERLPVIRLTIDPAKVEEAEVFPLTLYHQISSFLNRPVRMKWQPAKPPVAGQNTYYVRIQTGCSLSPLWEEILTLPVLRDKQPPLPLHFFVGDEEITDYGKIFHQNGIRCLKLSLEYPQGEGKKVEGIFQKLLEHAGLHKDIRLLHGREYRDRNKEYLSLGLCVFLALILIFILLVGVFESPVIPFFLILQLPIPLLFPLMVLSFLGIPLSGPVFFALILVVGIAVNNGIVLFHGIHRHTMTKKVIIRAVSKRSFSLVTALLTTLTAGVPLFFSGNGLNDPFTAISLTIGTGLFFSFLCLYAFLPFLVKETDKC